MELEGALEARLADIEGASADADADYAEARPGTGLMLSFSLYFRVFT